MRQVPFLALCLIAMMLATPPGTWGQDAPTPGAATATAASGDFAGLVDIGGRRLWLECRGERSPTVILESGYGNNAAIWDAAALPLDSGKTAVLPGVAMFTRVCAYDRPGTILDPEHRSRSDPAPMPRTAADVVADLHALLHAASVPGPFVLVGHSLGGVFARYYAAIYPDEVVGLVLVDSAHEDQNVRLAAALGLEDWAALERLQQQAPPGLEDYSERERIDLDTSFAQLLEVASARPLSPMPLVVLSHGVPLSAEMPPAARSALPRDFAWDELERTWQQMQDELASLAPEAKHVIASESGHYIQLQQPELVIAAVRSIVDTVRDPASWTTPTLNPASATPSS